MLRFHRRRPLQTPSPSKGSARLPANPMWAEAQSYSLVARFTRMAMPNPAITAAFNLDQFTQANQLLADGLNVNFIDVRKYVNSSTDMYQPTPPLALSAQGQQHVADAFAGKIQYIRQTAGTLIDPRSYGALCNAQLFNGNAGTGVATVSSGSPTISISGYSFSATDVGKSLVVSGSHDTGITEATIIAVAGDGSSATMNPELQY